MNTTEVDLTNCDREPIHLVGSVQGFGCLFAFKADWVLAHVSGNCQAFTGSPPADLLGRPAAEIMDKEALHAIRSRLQWLQQADATERLFGLDLLGNGCAYDVAVHFSGDLVVIEAEETDSLDRIDAVSIVRSMVARLTRAGDMDAFFKEATRQIRFLTGFDRVMIYQFLEDQSGEVIAETCSKSTESFLGLRYPASDIPQQARALYLRNLIRLVFDVDAETAKIEQRDPAGSEGLDLSLSILRAVSPIHLEYLRNMGVHASLSISIVVDGKLWGLIACHNLTPRKISFDRRTVAELFAQLFSLELSNRLREAAYETERESREVHDRVMASISVEGSVFENLAAYLDAFRDIIPCDGGAVWVNRQYSASGLSPTSAEFRPLIDFLGQTSPNDVFASHEISRYLPDAKSFTDGIAGVLAVPVSRAPRDYLLFFREEVENTVNWAGNPQKPVEPGPNGDRLTPRKSFETWRETVKGQSSPWTHAERRIAESLRMTLLEIFLRHSDHIDSIRQQGQVKQDLLVAELNHRVRNILSLIRGIVSQTGSHKDSVAEFIEVLDGRIQALARAHNQLTEKTGPPPGSA